MEMHHVRRGAGRPLLLVHGLGSSWRTWAPVMGALAAEREVVAVDLPGHGGTPPLDGEASIATFADALTAFMEARGLRDVDTVGSSMGARLVLELARRGVGGHTVALGPGGFWEGWERTFFASTIGASIRLVRALQPAMPLLTRSTAGRGLLFAQFSARPWQLPPDVLLTEVRGYAASPSLDPMLASLAEGPPQEGAPAGATPGRVTIGWGRHDRVCLPRQAERAQARFPGAQLRWFDESGHFPHWDAPAETVRVVLAGTAG
jgi:pimeloyl-ACP methyl ester carboxylesterase